MGRWGKDARDWTLQQINELCRLAMDGATGEEIGAALGKSRSAILGKCNRLKIKLSRKNKDKPRDYLSFIMKAPVPKPEKPMKIYEIPKNIPPENSLLVAGPFNCRWPQGNDPRTMTICGLPTFDGSSYCQDHKRQSVSGNH